MVLPGTRTDTIIRPGATRSGLAMWSAVGPSLDQLGMTSSLVLGVPDSSAAPAVTTSGSMPGVLIEPAVGPVLPAAATTTRPLRYAISAAAASGSSRYEPDAGAPNAI